jgi:ABC-type enterochelin transport system permease subunit
MFNHPIIWLLVSLLLLAACTFLPLRIQNDALRNFVMRWVLVPVSIVIIAYSYPVGIEVFKTLALQKP